LTVIAILKITFQMGNIIENKYIIKAGKKNAWAVSVGGYIFSHISTVYGPGYCDDLNHKKGF